MEINVENGTLEFAPSPDRINLIAEERGEDGGVELRLSPSERDMLAQAMERDEHLDLEEVDGARGLVAWEPERGLYVEEYGGVQFYLVLSPEQREVAVRAAREVNPA
jgi:hypothetical protein